MLFPVRIHFLKNTEAANTYHGIIYFHLCTFGKSTTYPPVLAVTKTTKNNITTKNPQHSWRRRQTHITSLPFTQIRNPGRKWGNNPPNAYYGQGFAVRGGIPHIQTTSRILALRVCRWPQPQPKPQQQSTLRRLGFPVHLRPRQASAASLSAASSFSRYNQNNNQTAVQQ